MAYTFTVDENYKVIVAQDGEIIDEVGAFDSAESAEYWANEMAKKYDANSTYVYPSKEPEADGQTL